MARRRERRDGNIAETGDMLWGPLQRFWAARQCDQRRDMNVKREWAAKGSQ